MVNFYIDMYYIAQLKMFKNQVKKKKLLFFKVKNIKMQEIGIEF